MARDLGDFQTPPPLVAAILEHLGSSRIPWQRVLEPTCGRGNFIAGLLDLAVPPREIVAIELQDAHLEAARTVAARASSTRVALKKANLFGLHLGRDLEWSDTGPLLVIGNPPWVTNSELGSLGSDNLPPKRNLKGLRGIDAMTGESNFDVAEAIWLKLIRELATERPTIALLCKTSVARNVLQFASSAGLPVARASIHRIDARKWFGVAVDACLFRVDIGPGRVQPTMHVYPDLHAGDPEGTIGIANGQLVADAEAYSRSAFADGVCPVTWRHGVKHDAGSVMELGYDDWQRLRNKRGEIVVLEPEYVYPLLKSTDLFRGWGAGPRRSIIVTQRHLGDDTRGLQVVAPKLWGYLSAHRGAFDRRASSVYRGQPPFSLFGIGEYAFALHKVGISGLHKTPRFRPIGPVDGRPMMLDDTCYFVPCYSSEQAALLAGLLNDPASLDLIRALAFPDSKRPITKKLLQRIDLRAVLDRCDRDSLLARADAELRRLGHDQGVVTWPSSLEGFLLQLPPNLVPSSQMPLF